jgi:hypothetical protein
MMSGINAMPDGSPHRLHWPPRTDLMYMAITSMMTTTSSGSIVHVVSTIVALVALPLAPKSIPFIVLKKYDTTTTTRIIAMMTSLNPKMPENGFLLVNPNMHFTSIIFKVLVGDAVRLVKTLIYDI